MLASDWAGKSYNKPLTNHRRSKARNQGHCASLRLGFRVNCWQGIGFKTKCLSNKNGSSKFGGLAWPNSDSVEEDQRSARLSFSVSALRLSLRDHAGANPSCVPSTGTQEGALLPHRRRKVKVLPPNALFQGQLLTTKNCAAEETARGPRDV